MAVATSFREDLKAAILERHCANHPMTEKWARGELSRNALMGWGIEHWHWVSRVKPATPALRNGIQASLTQSQRP